MHMHKNNLHEAHPAFKVMETEAIAGPLSSALS